MMDKDSPEHTPAQAEPQSSTSPTSVDPFAVTSSDLHPPKRLLRIGKSGESLPVTLRSTQKRVDVGLRLAAIPIGSTTTYLYGIEYDDASRGRHEGVYEGKQLFEVRQKGKGAGAFLLNAKDLRRGYTFAEALAERYDVDIPGSQRVRTVNEGEKQAGDKGIALGSTGIVVEAPRLREVRKRMAQLRRLQSIGLEEYNVSGLGGNEETRAFLRENLTSLTTLDLSNNLFTYWHEVAEVVSCIPSLRKIVLNDSRIERLDVHLDDKSKDAFIREAFKGIREVELCNCYMAWSDVMIIAPYLPLVQRLDLVDNTPLVDMDPLQSVNGVPMLLNLRYLNLAGCGITDWEALASGIRQLTQLETLDLSHTPLSHIPPPSSPPIRLANLILLSSGVSRWADIDALQRWTGDTLASLKFTLSPALPPEADPLRISGDPAADRLTLIAKLPALVMLNSTPVNASERRDAEVAYVKMVNQLVASSTGKSDSWGRYEELKRAHELVGAGQTVNLKLGHLRSRLYDLSVYIAGANRTLEHAADISVLPSAPMALLRKKIHRALKGAAGQEIKLWTVSERFVEGERGKATEVPDGETVGWWFADGDEVIAEM